MKTDFPHVDTVESSKNPSVTAMVANGLTEISVAIALQDVFLVTLMETVENVKQACGYGITLVKTSVHSASWKSQMTHVIHPLVFTTFMSSHFYHLKTDVKSGNPALMTADTSSEYTGVRQNLDMNAAKEVSKNHSSSPTEEPGSMVNTT